MGLNIIVTSYSRIDRVRLHSLLNLRSNRTTEQIEFKLRSYRTLEKALVMSKCEEFFHLVRNIRLIVSLGEIVVLVELIDDPGVGTHTSCHGSATSNLGSMGEHPLIELVSLIFVGRCISSSTLTC